MTYYNEGGSSTQTAAMRRIQAILAQIQQTGGYPGMQSYGASSYAGNPYAATSVMTGPNSYNVGASPYVGAYNAPALAMATEGQQLGGLLSGDPYAQTNPYQAAPDVAGDLASAANAAGNSVTDALNRIFGAAPDPSNDPNANDGNGGPRNRGGGNSLYQQLVKAASDVPTIDFDKLIAENTQAINEAYAPQIAGLRGQNKATRQQYTKSAGAVGDMTSQLAKHFERVGNREENQAGDRADRITQAATARANGMDTRSANNNAKTIAAMKAAGLGEASISKVMKSNKQTDVNAGYVLKEGADRAQHATNEGDRNSKYYATMGAAAAIMGDDQLANLMEQRNSIIAGNRQGIAGLKGARGSDIVNMTTTLNQTEAEQNVAAQNEVYDRLMGLLGFREQKREFNVSTKNSNAIAAAQLAAQGGGSATDPYSYLDTNTENLYRFIDTAFPDTESNAAVHAAINTINDQYMTGGAIPGEWVPPNNPNKESVPITGPVYAKFVIDELIKGGMDPSRAQGLYDYLKKEV